MSAACQSCAHSSTGSIAHCTTLAICMLGPWSSWNYHTSLIWWIIIAIDYFTKWVEAVPLVSPIGVQVSKFILYHIICRFGIQSTIFTDYGGNFENLNMEELCTSLHIHHHFSSPYFPQGNDEVEATNKTLLKILKKVVNDSGRDWHLQINPALWACNTPKLAHCHDTNFGLFRSLLKSYFTRKILFLTRYLT